MLAFVLFYFWFEHKIDFTEFHFCIIKESTCCVFLYKILHLIQNSLRVYLLPRDLFEYNIWKFQSYILTLFVCPCPFSIGLSLCQVSIVRLYLNIHCPLSIYLSMCPLAISLSIYYVQCPTICLSVICLSICLWVCCLFIRMCVRCLSDMCALCIHLYMCRMSVFFMCMSSIYLSTFLSYINLLSI